MRDGSGMDEFVQSHVNVMEEMTKVVLARVPLSGVRLLEREVSYIGQGARERRWILLG